jgi:glucose-1-phosphate thymidylyltransferase
VKVIIPVAGVGSKLRPHTHTQPKSLIPVAGKPILAHIIDYLHGLGFDEFIFVIGYMGEKIEDFIQQRYPNIKTEFLVQSKGKGTAYAIWTARESIKDNDEVFIVFGDTIFKADMETVLQSETSMLGTKKVDDPRNFGVVEVDDNGSIKRLEEKPKMAVSNLALIGAYKIRNTDLMVDCLRQIIEESDAKDGEYHLTDALNLMINRGETMKTFPVTNWFDCGKKDILLETNAILLKEQKEKNGKNVTIQDSILIEPVFIGGNCVIKNSILGPNVSIGDDAIVDYTIIKNSIVGPHSELQNANLIDSIIGSDSSLKGNVQTLNIGDSTEIDFT